MESASPFALWPAFQEQDIVVVWSASQYTPVQVIFVEPLPLGIPLRQDLGAIATGATISATLPTVTQLGQQQLLQLRLKPLDDVDLHLYLQRGQAKFWIRNSHCTINLFTGIADPSWRSTTFFVQSQDRDPYVEAFNYTSYNLTTCRIQFWGWRAIWRDLPGWSVPNPNERILLNPQGQPAMMNPYTGRAVLWLPADGRQQ